MPKINRDGVEIYYEVHGSGPPLLLTHGYSSTSQMWQGQVEALSKQHKLVLWDMRGHGRSDYPDDASAYSEALTVADMAALLDAIGANSAASTISSPPAQATAIVAIAPTMTACSAAVPYAARSRHCGHSQS